MYYHTAIYQTIHKGSYTYGKHNSGVADKRRRWWLDKRKSGSISNNPSENLV